VNKTRKNSFIGKRQDNLVILDCVLKDGLNSIYRYQCDCGKIFESKRMYAKSRLNKHFSESRKEESEIKNDLHLDIKKFKKENFVFQICKICHSKDELDNEEGKLIEKYKTYDEKYGYNLDRFVDGVKIRSKITLEKFQKFYKSEKIKEVAKQRRLQNRGAKRTGASKYVGVYPQRNKWASYIHINNKTIPIGCHHSEDDAAMSADIYLLEYLGEDAKINFPELKDKYISGEIIIKRPKRSKKEDIKFRGFKTQNKEDNQ
jgi:hypothetical protein